MDEVKRALLFSQIKKVGATEGKPLRPQTQPVQGGQAGGTSFDEVLNQSEVQFSKHAEKRLQSRKIEISATERARLSEALGALQKKGAKDSLVLMGEMAFVVNVPSKTVVTAIMKEQMKEQIFTNIDSTMVVES